MFRMKSAKSPKAQKPVITRKMYLKYKEIIASSNVTPNEAIIELLGTMKTVDTTSEEAKKNAGSMDDNNGGRIIYTGTPETLKDEIDKDNK